MDWIVSNFEHPLIAKKIFLLLIVMSRMINVNLYSTVLKMNMSRNMFMRTMTMTMTLTMTMAMTMTMTMTMIFVQSLLWLRRFLLLIVIGQITSTPFVLPLGNSHFPSLFHAYFLFICFTFTFSIQISLNLELKR